MTTKKTATKKTATKKATRAAKKAEKYVCTFDGSDPNMTLAAAIEKMADALKVDARTRVSECLQYATFISIANDVPREKFLELCGMIWDDIQANIGEMKCPECERRGHALCHHIEEEDA